jgi:peroxiredoxin Q/BCP
MMKKPLAACMLVLLPTALAIAARLSAAAVPEIGDQAPDFKLPGSDGKTYKLEDFKEKKAVVIAWFPKAFTGG